MKLIYLADGPFGETYFNPETHEGIGLSRKFPPLTFTMDPEWGAQGYPGAFEFDCDPDAYQKFRNAIAVNDASTAYITLEENFKPLIPKELLLVAEKKRCLDDTVFLIEQLRISGTMKDPISLDLKVY